MATTAEERNKQLQEELAFVSAMIGPSASARVPVEVQEQPAANEDARNLPYGAATIPQPSTSTGLYSAFASAAPATGTSQAAPLTAEQSNVEAIQFWSNQPGFAGVQNYLDPENKLDDDDLYKEQLIVEQAQAFLKYREGAYKDGQEDLSDLSTTWKRRLSKPFSELSEEDRKEIIDEAITEIGWINNNTGSMTKAFFALRGDDVPAEQKQAALFMMDLSSNMSFTKDWAGQSWRFIYQGILADPTTVASVALGAVSFGAGTVAAQAGIQTARITGMQALRSQLTKLALKPGLKAGIAKGAAFGAGTGAGVNSLEQNIRTSEFELNGSTFQRQEGFSWSELGYSTAFGAAFGGGMSATGYYGAHLWNKFEIKDRLSRVFGQSSKADEAAATPAAASIKTESKADTNPADEAVEAASAKTTPETPASTKTDNKADAQTAPHAETKEADAPKAEKAEAETETPTPSPSAAQRTARTYDKFDTRKLPTSEANKVNAQVEKINDLFENPDNFKDVVEIASNPGKLEAFLKAKNVNVSKLHDTVKEQLVDDGHIMLLAQQAAFVQRVNRAIKTRAGDVDTNKLFKEYSLLDSDNNALNNKVTEYTNFKDSRRLIDQKISQTYTDMINEGEDKLNAIQKDFVAQYKKTYEGTGNAENYANLEKSYIKLLRADGLEIPEIDNSTSPRTAGFYFLLQNPKHISAMDALRVAPKYIPLDSIDNINNGIGAIDNIFMRHDFQKEVFALQERIRTASKKVNEGADADTVRNEISDIMSDFSNRNRDNLAKMADEIAMVEYAINDWPSVANGRTSFWKDSKNGNAFGLAKGISTAQKNNLLYFVSDMRQMVTEMQKPNFGKKGSALAEAKSAEEFEYSINHILGSAVSSYRAHTKTDPFTGKKSEIQHRMSRARAIEMAAYTRARPKSSLGYPNDPGNLESLLDKSTYGLAMSLIEKKGDWSVPQRGDFANDILEFVNNNMLGEALYAIRELRWRIENKPGDYYNTDWVNDVKNRLDIKGNPYHAEAFQVIEKAAQKGPRQGGGKPGLFGKDWFGGMGGGRWAEEEYIKITWPYRLATRLSGTADGSDGIMNIATPVKYMVLEDIKKRLHTGFNYTIGKVKSKEVDDEGYPIWHWGSDQKTGHVGNLPLVGKVWNHTLATPLRVAGRIAMLPEALAYQGAKMLYRQFGNTAKVIGGTAALAGTGELAISAATNTEAPFNILAHTLDTTLTGVDYLAASLEVAQDGKMAILEGAGLDNDSFMANALRLWDAPETVWDWTHDNLDHFIDNRIGNYGEEAHALNLMNFTRDYNAEEIHASFLENFKDIDSRIQAAETEQYRQSLLGIKEQFPTINALKIQIASDLSAANAARDATKITLTEAEKGLNITGLSDEEITAKEQAYSTAQSAFDAAQAKLDEAEYRKDYFGKYLQTVAVSDVIMQDINERIAEINSALDEKPNAVTRKILKKNLEREEHKLIRQMELRNQAYTALTGKEAPTVTARQNVESEEQSDDTPVETQTQQVTTPAQTSAKNPFAAANKPAQTQRPAATNPATQSQRSTSRDESQGDSVEQLWAAINEGVGHDIGNGLRGTFSNAGNFIGNAFDAVTSSKSPWVGGTLAVLGAWFGMNMLSGEGRGSMANTFGGILKMVGFAAAALGIFAGWRHFTKDDSASNNARDNAAPSAPVRSGTVVPLMGQSQSGSTLFPANDPNFSGPLRRSQGHDGRGMNTSGDNVVTIGAQVSGNNLAPRGQNSQIDGFSASEQVSSINHTNNTRQLGTQGTTFKTPGGTELEDIQPVQMVS